MARFFIGGKWEGSGEPFSGDVATPAGGTKTWKDGKPVKLVDERGNVRTYNEDGSSSVVGPTGTSEISKSKAQTEAMLNQAKVDTKTAEDKAATDKITADNAKRWEPYIAIGLEGSKLLGEYRNDPAGYVKRQFGFAEGEAAGQDQVTKASLARGDFLGDASEKRMRRFNTDYLSTKKKEELDAIYAMLNIGASGSGAVQTGDFNAQGLKQNSTGLEVGTMNNGSQQIQQSILQASLMRHNEALQRKQNIADRQTATINTVGNVLTAIPSLFAPVPTKV